MPSISVRGLDEITYSGLRVRAASNHHSMEEEARQILKTAVCAPERIGDRFLSHFGREHGAVLELPTRRPHKPLDLK
jgi:antitoxin FitA